MKNLMIVLVSLIAMVFESAVSAMFRLLPCAFDATNMNRVQAGTMTLWLYKSPDTIISMVASGYFNAYAPELRQGDIILAVDISTGLTSVTVSSADGATPVTVVKTS